MLISFSLQGLSELITTIESVLKVFNPHGDYYITAYNIAHLERSLANVSSDRSNICMHEFYVVDYL